MVQSMDARVRSYRLQDDLTKHVWTITNDDSVLQARLAYVVEPGGDVVLAGQLAGDSVHMRLHRVVRSSFQLFKGR